MNKSYYDCILGKLELTSDKEYLLSISYIDEPIKGNKLQDECLIEDEIIIKTKEWLDRYFKGENPAVDIPLKIKGTPFQMEVYEILRTIPYGKTVSYKDISTLIAKSRGIEKFSSQAIGQAVKRNPLQVIIPCHRVVGSKGDMVGYAGGLDRKRMLLETEGYDFSCKSKK